MPRITPFDDQILAYMNESARSRANGMFGSYTRGKARPDSDLAFLSGSTSNKACLV